MINGGNAVYPWASVILRSIVCFDVLTKSFDCEINVNQGGNAEAFVPKRFDTFGMEAFLFHLKLIWEVVL
ncbi:hypothetical protein LC20004_09910 [Loigolactobacillus coryniformis subsp. torquens DSM 20004 = KCTC 3535]|uniref:Uncharacterized protein n=1 Tax=Loigolactobacillus coryniformis subsp. torquens DSM 20004 = KCTC 3535 TaxID=1423822 RepID=A0A2D1KPZ5_9LACO|nr:hypothetical protein LC20004_09910 [Loigolactobacillus coryniformis subsp. torquens DSM 20004 = KCTC 3535]